jgi:tetratricopeptide (TPR) repeat protein
VPFTVRCHAGGAGVGRRCATGRGRAQIGGAALAVNKRKILEAARKLAQKGAKDKALAEYQKLVKLDPKDSKLRLEIGDAHRRWGQVDEAVDTYRRVAEQYMAEGFDARAVAVFKQILNLDPDRLDAYAPLAELYERMGLNAEALAALQTAADGYHRQGKKSEALDLLRKMANADPSNTRSRIKVADLLRQEGKAADAATEYQLAADELERQGDVEAVANVYRRILEVDDRNVRAFAALAQNLATRGKVAEAIPLAERALKLDDGNAERYELLAGLYERAQRAPDQERIARGLAELYRQRGEEGRAREILQQYAGIVELGSATPMPEERARDELHGGGDPSLLFDKEFPEAEGAPEFSVDFGSGMEIDPGASLSANARTIDPGATLSSTQRVPSGGSADGGEELLLEDVRDPPPLSAMDLEQLFAEASVYLRYGKRDKAIAHLQKVIQAQPDHRIALEKMGEAYAESGEHTRAVGMWQRAAMRAHAEGDAEALRVLRGRIAVLDESAASKLPTLGREPAASAPSAPAARPAAPAAAPASSAGADLDELVLDDDEFLDEIGLDDRNELALETGDEDGSDFGGVDLDGGVDFDVEADAGSGAAASEAESDVEIDVDSEISIDVEADDEELAPETASAPAPAPAQSGSGTSLGASLRQQILDDLEEADFYMQQGLHDEAEGIYRRILDAAPNHPRALLKLGEIEAARAGQAEPVAKAAPKPSAKPAAKPAAQPARPVAIADADETPVPDIDLADDDPLVAASAAADEPEEEVDIPVDIADEGLGEPEPLGATAPELGDFASLDLDATEPGGDTEPETAKSETDSSDTQEIRAGAAAAAAAAAAASPRPAPAAKPAARPAAAPTPAARVAASIASPDDSDGGFDLAAALADAFDDEDPGISKSRIAAPPGDDGFAAVFQAFKKGVRETLSEGDHQAHYDLAIAYKEMGLYDDAIFELRTAMADPNRTAECLHLIGLCAIDADQAPLAIEHLEQLLSLPSLVPAAALAGRFDLGRALESVGDIEGARREFQAVAAVDPTFQGVRQRLAGLGAPKPDDSSDSGFESFDDVMVGVDDDQPVEVEEVAVGGETFDDLVAEANDPVEVVAEAMIEDEPMVDAEPVEEPPPAARPGRPAKPAPAPAPAAQRKKKKISFL